MHAVAEEDELDEILGGGAPMIGELRLWPELARLLIDPLYRSPGHAPGRPPVLLIPGFLAGDLSLMVLADWLRRRGHHVRLSGIRINTGCAGRDLTRIERMLDESDEPVVVVGQSRGGTLARALAVARPDRVGGLVMLGSPVRNLLAVSPPVLRAIRSVAALGDLGLPWTFSTACLEGECCEQHNSLLRQPLPAEMPALAVYSRSDGIVDWRACLDPDAECVEVDGSHCGMAVNARVYRELERALDRVQAVLE